MKKDTKRLLGRIIFIGLAILIQLAWIIFAVVVIGNRYPIVTFLIQTMSVIAVLWLVHGDMNPAFKLAWTILILAVPIAGAVIYFLLGKSRLARDLDKRLSVEYTKTKEFLKEDEETDRQLFASDPNAHCQSCYIRDYAGFPVYQNTETRYFKVGEDLYETLIQELKKAEHFIFMEYFIIDDGEMWQGILDILEEKVRMGVDVRLIYDDFGCVSTLPPQFQMQLRLRGIRCEIFNPLMPIASIVLNNRDHRKITVIDGETAFTGGINLADEYINRKKRFGYWKDTGIMLKGQGVWSFTVMFLQMWSVLAKEQVDYEKYRPGRYCMEEPEGNGFVQPYGDTPLDSETVGEYVYLNIINRARKYVYIFTPYLITDNEVITALCLASKSGVDVRIVTPGIPDKKMVFMLTQSYYETLLKAGVRIFEYQPGFLHAKSFVSDDEIAAVGTINLDFRSLYLHFECGVWMYQTTAVMQIAEDARTLFRECREIQLKDTQNKRLFRRFCESILKLFAPLL